MATRSSTSIPTPTPASLDEPTPYNHGTPFYRGVNEGFMRGDHIFQIGLRGTWPYPGEFDWMREVGFRWRTMDEVM